MGERLDTVRSFLAQAAGLAGRRLGEIPALADLRKALADVQSGRSAVGEAELTAALAHAPGVASATVLARRGALHLDISFSDGGRWEGRVVPEGAHFAPRGAKEVHFRIEPPELANESRLPGVLGVLGGVLARTLWSMLIPRTVRRGVAGHVDRQGLAGYRIDLRSVPEVRRLADSGVFGNALDVLDLKSVSCEDGELRLQLGLLDGLRGA